MDFSINKFYELFAEKNIQCKKEGSFQKNTSPEKMMSHSLNGFSNEEWSVKGNFVDIINNYIKVLFPGYLEIQERHPEVK